MLTDVFVTRYEETPIFTDFGERERRFLVQMSKLITEQLFPYYIDGKENESAKQSLQFIHDRLAMEIGVDALSIKKIGSYTYSIRDIVKNFLQKTFEDGFPLDRFMKNRISFVELSFRERESQVKDLNAELPRIIRDLKTTSPNRTMIEISRISNIEKVYVSNNNHFNREIASNIHELNERFRQARFPFTYHGGFIQFANDALIAATVEKPFWNLVRDPKWENVEHDMLEAVDRRDNKGRDAALYGAKALESVIKIISADKGWTTGNERGASNFIDNLVSQKNGRFIEVWESEAMKAFFSKVRNPLGHGPGGEVMPSLTEQQNSWAIETCMSWIKSLITRI